MPDDKEEIGEMVTKEPIPEYFLKFLRDYAEANRPSDKLVPIHISIEHVEPSICADEGAAISEIQVLYKRREWIEKHKRGDKDA